VLSPEDSGKGSRAARDRSRTGPTMGVILPKEVIGFLAGWPVMGSAEQVIPLLSVDANDLPHACLLSRAQLDASTAEVRASVTSLRTRANLRRTGAALILVTLGDTVHHCKLGVLRARDSRGTLLVAFEPLEHKADTMGIPLSPMTFVASSWIASVEHWDETAVMLRSLDDP
jgi:hypothetical protein